MKIVHENMNGLIISKLIHGETLSNWLLYFHQTVYITFNYNKSVLNSTSHLRINLLVS